MKKYSVSQYMRNPEIKRELALYFAVGVMGVLGSLFVFPHAPFWDIGGAASEVSGIVLMWAAASVMHFGSSFCRYRKLSMLSNGIDAILHRDEINKLMIRLKEQNEELRRQKTYLADSLADLSHQLRTPLTSMNLIFPMLAEEGITEEKRQEYLWKLQRLLQKVQWMIDVLLKISKLDADAVHFLIQPCPIERLVRDAAAAIEIPMELKGQKLLLEIEEGAAFAGDMRWTGEAVVNIMKNCMEHTGEGGTIRVSGRENALFAELVIEDNGPGIEKEDLPHIFERFYSRVEHEGKNSGETSVGIGLALASMIIRKEAGMISAENRSDGGARFRIRFYKDTV